MPWDEFFQLMGAMVVGSAIAIAAIIFWGSR